MSEYKWKVLWIAAIGSFMGSLDGTIVNIAIPTISADLGVNFDIVQWVTIIYLLVNAITLVAFGRLADIRGRKRYFFIGLTLFTISSLFDALSISAFMLILFRAIQGIGTSLVSANAPAMITDAFPPQERGKAMGFNIAAIYLGTTIGPILGGILVPLLSWRSIFYVNVPIGMILIPYGWFALKQDVLDNKTQIFDTQGTIVFGICLFALLLGLSLGNTIGWLNPINILFFLIAIITLFWFISIESKAPAPMININLLRHNKNFVAGNATALLNYIALNGNLFLLSIYLQSFKGYPVIFAGLLILPTPLTQSIVSLKSGSLSDKIGTRSLVALGMGLLAIGFFLAVIVVNFLSTDWFLLSQLVIGAGVGFFSSPNQSTILGSVEKEGFRNRIGNVSNHANHGSINQYRNVKCNSWHLH